MVHYAFPSVPRRHHWIEEGTATYVEPIARFQIGNLTAARVWGDMLRDMHQGLPEDGDRGLDNTHTWGRTYWGGALFCLLADIGIRKNTANAKGLEDAWRAINRAGGTIEVDWPLDRALEVGDKATGGKTLMDLYRKMGAQPICGNNWESGGRMAGCCSTIARRWPVCGRPSCGAAPGPRHRPRQDNGRKPRLKALRPGLPSCRLHGGQLHGGDCHTRLRGRTVNLHCCRACEVSRG
jgi:hypothetical protein